MPCIKKCYQQTTHQSQPSTSFYTNKVTLLKKSLKQTYYRSKLKTVEMMLKKHGKLLMNLFLQNLKKNKVGGEMYNADLNTIKTFFFIPFSYLKGRYPSIDATLFQIAQIWNITFKKVFCFFVNYFLLFFTWKYKKTYIQTQHLCKNNALYIIHADLKLRIYTFCMYRYLTYVSYNYEKCQWCDFAFWRTVVRP